MEQNDLVDQIYNGNFLLANIELPNFPDGWEKIGGDISTNWEWLGPREGPRALSINHPEGPRAGIIQSVDVPILAGDNQRWEFKLQLNANPAGVLCYLRIFLGSITYEVSKIYPTEESNSFSFSLTTPVGTNGIQVEVGIIGKGQLIIHEVNAYRLYPQQPLKLDNKGQIFVKQVETIGQIQRPVPVRILHPLPLPVDFKATISEDIRDLTPQRDGVRIYDSHSNQILSTPEGALKVHLASRQYIGTEEGAIAGPTELYTLAKDVSVLSNYSFAIKNRGLSPIWIRLEIGPDDSNWVADSMDVELSPGQLKVFVPQLFLRFIRVAYKAINSTPLTIWFQAQA